MREIECEAEVLRRDIFIIERKFVRQLTCSSGINKRLRHPSYSLEGISQKVLTDSLRQMMDDSLVYRQDYHQMPPKVEYGLTDLGKKMQPIIEALAEFGEYYKSVVE